MITSSSVIRPRLGSMTRRAQALVRACHYWREYSTCLTGVEESALRARIPSDAFPVREPADQLALNRHWKAEARVGDFADVIAAIKTDPAVSTAARRTLSLLGGSALTIHGFGPGWQEMGSVIVESTHGVHVTMDLVEVWSPDGSSSQYWDVRSPGADGYRSCRLRRDGSYIDGDESLATAGAEGAAALERAATERNTIIESGRRSPQGVWTF